MTHDWKFVAPETMTLRDYSCGVSAGDILSLKEDLHYRDSKGQTTGKVRKAGDEAMILTGYSDEPDVVWIRWRDGTRQTWSDTILDGFDRTGKVI